MDTEDAMESLAGMTGKEIDLLRAGFSLFRQLGSVGIPLGPSLPSASERAIG